MVSTYAYWQESAKASPEGTQYAYKNAKSAARVESAIIKEMPVGFGHLLHCF